MPSLAEEGYQLLTTEEMLGLMLQGRTLTLPATSVDASMLSSYSDEELAHLNLEGDLNDIVAIEPVGEEEVQCILVDDPEHLYLTDGFIPTHNTSNIVFLKSTDDDMIKTLEGMSGTTHKSYINTKQVSRDIEKIWMRNEGIVSYTMSTEEKPVISYNDLAFISERNSIVFRAGDAPVWNRNETILPMSWRLFSNKIAQPGKDYTLQTIPTLSSAIDFDVRKNQPDFQKMLDKRIAQAVKAPEAMKSYQQAFGYTDYDIEQLDPDIYAEAIMGLVDSFIQAEAADAALDDAMSEEDGYASDPGTLPPQVGPQYDRSAVEKDMDVINETRMRAKVEQQRNERRFAGGLLAYSDLLSPSGLVSHGLYKQIVSAFIEVKGSFEQDHDNFAMKGGNLYATDGVRAYITQRDESEDLAKLSSASKSSGTKVFSDDDGTGEVDVSHIGSYQVHDAFIRFLAQRDRWDFANGRFEEQMHRELVD